MNKTTAPAKTPSPQLGVIKSREGAERPRRLGLTFAAAALDMSWRLAAAVLIPIVGGYWLDRHFHTTPALTIIGFIVAMAGLYAVLKQTLDTADEKFSRADAGDRGGKGAKR